MVTHHTFDLGSMLDSTDMTDVMDDLEFVEDYEVPRKEEENNQIVLVPPTEAEFELVRRTEANIQELLERGPSFPMAERVPLLRDVVMSLVVCNRAEIAECVLNGLSILQPDLVREAIAQIPLDILNRLQLVSV